MWEHRAVLRNSGLAAVLALCWLAGTTDLEAQTTSLPGVTVLGSRQTRDLQEDEAASGTVLLPEDWDDAGESLSTLLDQQAGVRVTRVGGAASLSVLSIRGSNSDQVLVVLDGVVLNEGSGGPVDLSRLPLGAVERIELYRGSSPILFGSSAIGGVLSLTTKSPRKRQLSASAGVGSWWAREAQLRFEHPGRNWDLFLGADYTGWEGAFPFVNDGGTRFDPTDDVTQERKNNQYDQLNVLGKARLRWGKWRLTPMEWFFWRKQGVPGLGSYPTLRTQFESMGSLTALTLEGRRIRPWLDTRLQASMRVETSHLDDPLDEAGLSGGEGRDLTLTPGITGLVRVHPLDWLTVTGQAGVRLESFEPQRGGGPSPGAFQRQSASVALEPSVLLRSADLKLSALGRLEWLGNQHSSGSGLEATTPPGEVQETDWSCRLSAVNQSIPGTRLAASLGRSIRAPSLFELFGNSGRVVGNPTLVPETAWTLDLTAVHQVEWSGTSVLQTEVSFYATRVEDLIQWVQTAQNVASAENVDRALLAGGEAAVRWDVLSHLRVSGNYSYLYAVNEGNIAAREGKRLPMRPAHQVYGRVEGYSRQFKDWRELSLFVDSQWLSSNFLDNANLVEIPSRGTLGCGVAAELGRPALKVSFAVRNLTNQATSDLAGYPLPGLSVHLLVTVNAW